MSEDDSFFSFERGVYWHGLGKMLLLPIYLYLWLAFILKTNLEFILLGVLTSLLLSIVFVFSLDKHLKKWYQQKKTKHN